MLLASCALLVRCTDPASSVVPSPEAGAAVDATAPPNGEDAALADVGAPCSRDLENDAKNCGRCDHDCLGGACARGTCQPIVLAADQYRPFGLVLDNDYVYYASNGDVFRLPKAGGARTLVAGARVGPVFVSITSKGNSFVGPGLALDATSVYVLSAATHDLLRIPKDGSDPDGGVSVGATNANYSTVPNFVAADGVQVFAATNAGHLVGAPAAGPTRVVGSFPGGSAYGFALDANNVFVSTGSSVATASKVLPPEDAGADAQPTVSPLPLALTNQDPWGIASDGTYLYWANTATGSVKKMPIAGLMDGGAATVLAANLDQPHYLALDGTSVYFTTSSTVGACPLAGCVGNERVLAERQAQPYAIAVDDKAVYWVCVSGGTVMKVAK